jgi:hypothetical protein
VDGLNEEDDTVPVALVRRTWHDFFLLVVMSRNILKYND